MASLPRFTLSHDAQTDRWKLRDDANGRVVRSFERKADATERGVLRAAVGRRGGSVRIQKERGGFQEERTYPGNRDPKRSPG